MKFPYQIGWQFVGSIDRLILFDARASFCSDHPNVRAHMYLFALYRKVPATYIYIYPYHEKFGNNPPSSNLQFSGGDSKPFHFFGGDPIFFMFTPYLGKIPILTNIFFKWVVQPPTIPIGSMGLVYLLTCTIKTNHSCG